MLYAHVGKCKDPNNTLFVTGCLTFTLRELNDKEITSPEAEISTTIKTLQECLTLCLDRQNCMQISYYEAGAIGKTCKLYDTYTPGSDFSLRNDSVVIKRLCVTGNLLVHIYYKHDV